MLPFDQSPKMKPDPTQDKPGTGGGSNDLKKLREEIAKDLKSVIRKFFPKDFNPARLNAAQPIATSENLRQFLQAEAKGTNFGTLIDQAFDENEFSQFVKINPDSDTGSFVELSNIYTSNQVLETLTSLGLRKAGANHTPAGDTILQRGFNIPPKDLQTVALNLRKRELSSPADNLASTTNATSTAADTKTTDSKLEAVASPKPSPEQEVQDLLIGMVLKEFKTDLEKDFEISEELSLLECDPGRRCLQYLNQLKKIDDPDFQNFLKAAIKNFKIRFKLDEVCKVEPNGVIRQTYFQSWAVDEARRDEQGCLTIQFPGKYHNDSFAKKLTDYGIEVRNFQTDLANPKSARVVFQIKNPAQVLEKMKAATQPKVLSNESREVLLEETITLMKILARKYSSDFVAGFAKANPRIMAFRKMLLSRPGDDLDLRNLIETISDEYFRELCILVDTAKVKRKNSGIYESVPRLDSSWLSENSQLRTSLRNTGLFQYKDNLFTLEDWHKLPELKTQLLRLCEEPQSTVVPNHSVDSEVKAQEVSPQAKMEEAVTFFLAQMLDHELDKKMFETLKDEKDDENFDFYLQGLANYSKASMVEDTFKQFERNERLDRVFVIKPHAKLVSKKTVIPKTSSKPEKVIWSHCVEDVPADQPGFPTLVFKAKFFKPEFVNSLERLGFTVHAGVDTDIGGDPNPIYAVQVQDVNHLNRLNVLCNGHCLDQDAKLDLDWLLKVYKEEEGATTPEERARASSEILALTSDMSAQAQWAFAENLQTQAERENQPQRQVQAAQELQSLEDATRGKIKKYTPRKTRRNDLEGRIHNAESRTTYKSITDALQDDAKTDAKTDAKATDGSLDSADEHPWKQFDSDQQAAKLSNTSSLIAKPPEQAQHDSGSVVTDHTLSSTLNVLAKAEHAVAKADTHKLEQAGHTALAVVGAVVNVFRSS